MNITIISGSHKETSQSSKIAHWLSKHLKGRDNSIETDIIDLADSPVPLWDEAAWDNESDLAKEMKPYLDKVAKADGLILISPEWHGMVPAGLKNFLLYVTSKHAAHKPALIVGVSASSGGAYPVAELRMSGYKNNRMVYIPDHLIVRDCKNVMNTPELDRGNENDQYIKKRAAYSLDILLAYAQSLKAMREHYNLLDPDYPNGM